MTLPRALSPALAALLIAIAPAHAGTPGQDLLFPFGGVPSWVLKPPGGPAPTIDMNFASGQYYGLQPSQLSVTRASPDNEVCNGTLYQFGNNVAPITPCGLWAWEARTNSVPNNTNQGAGAGAYPTGWSVFNPSGATVTVLGTTVNNGVSYLGVQLSGTTTSTSQIQIFQTSGTGIAATAGQVWTQSIYAYYSGSLTGITNVGAQANWNTSGGAYVSGPFGVSFTPTTSPVQYQGSTLISGGTVAFLQPLIGINVTTGQTLNVNFYFALSQMEYNPNATTAAQGFATGPILTSGTAVTRAAGQITATVSNNYNSFSLAAKATAFSQLPVGYPAIIEFDNGLNDLAGILLSSSTANSVYLRQYIPSVDSLFSSYSTGVKFIFGATFESGAYMTSINGIPGANSAVTGSQLALSTFRLGSTFNGNSSCDCLISRATVFGTSGLSQSALNYVTSH